ncbi:FixH family protein [Occallatibacter riparius]|uniref:FixH family protein n=1 Tax=Occallatibacter riparius TaxID=1002689 RepID=A0A9J7BMV0_9BACT|nr:FixH family protein [Occallatibacter riparius]UWZ84212.1 FixH family protein [Occallatibacter riparius]
MSDRIYQKAFFLVLAVCVVLAAAVGYLYLHRGHSAAVVQSDDPVVARGPEVAGAVTPKSAVSPVAEPQLGSIQISPQRLQQIGVTTAVAEMKNVSDKLSVPGNVDIDEQSLSYVQTRFAGWIQNVYANATYQYVKKGQRLFTIYSPDLVSTEQEYLLAKQNQKSVAHDAHGMAAQEGGWLLDAAEERLRQFGVPAPEIAALEQNGKVQREIAIESPASGFITERTALPNAYVQPDSKLYTIADLSTVWVYANVFQEAVGRLKPGDPAQVSVDAYPGREFNGRVDQILPQVDPATRTVRVRLVFRNPGVVLKPGMYVKVDINVALGKQLVVPASAVLQSGARAVAFIDHGEGNLEPREVQTGPQVDGAIVVLKGLQAGDRIVTSANFLVDSEAQLQAALGAFNPPQQGANAAPSQAPGAQPEQIKIAMTTEPATPQKGKNTVRITVSGADGKPVDGVQVSAVFFMPAMPEMGMAAERAAAALNAKGQGSYEGPLELPSGGTFQVTVTVQRAGATIATKKLTVAATGGM